MKKRILTILLILIGATNTFSQLVDPGAYERNSSKYWIYRERLNQNFITKIGPTQGQSLPAAERKYLIPGTFTIYNCLKYGDTPALLSMYISMLATEKKLLEMTFQPSDETTKELFYAVIALYRLDAAAEPFYGGAATLNGFFIRDDATQLSSSTLQKVNQGMPTENFISYVNSDFEPGLIGSAEGWHNQLNEMSKDQVYWVLMGLSVLKKSVSNTAYYLGPIGTNNQGIPPTTLIPHTFPDGSLFFHDAIKFLTKKIFEHFRYNDPKGWAWIINNSVCPDPGADCYDNYPNGCAVYRGWDGYSLSAPLMKTYKNLTGENLDVLFYSLIGLPNASFHRYMVAKGLWNYMRDAPMGSEDFKICLINATTNYWYNGDAADNADNLYWRSHNAFAHFTPTLHAYLYDEGTEDYQCNDYNQFNFASLRNRFSASHCKGIYNYGVVNGQLLWGDLNWSSSSALLHENSIGDVNPNITGDYNGIDYMLWHNLWYLNWSRTTFPYLPPFTNKNTVSSYYFPIPLPTPNPGFNYGFDQNDEFEYLSFNDIKAYCTVLTTSNTKLRSGNSVELLQGFETQGNVFSFTAEVDPPECHANGFVYRSENPPLVLGEIPNTKIENIKINQLVVYPNPTKEAINVLFADGVEFNSDQIKISDINGRIVTVDKLKINQKSSIHKLDVSKLNPGVYFISCDLTISKFIKL